MKRLNVVIAMVALILVLSAIGCSLGSSEAELAYNDGMAYGELGEYVTAISNFTKAIQLDPDYADAYNHRGDAYRRLGQNQNAIADYTMAIELESNEDSINRYYHQLRLTCSALDQGRTLGDGVEPC